MPDPREFYAATRLVLMPSLWYESFGLVAAEAMLNGIPVLASNRGALPETIGDAGFLFDIPARYTSGDARRANAGGGRAVGGDDHSSMGRRGGIRQPEPRGRAEHALQWHPDRLAPIYREFFSRITHQPGPPLVPIQSAREI